MITKDGKRYPTIADAAEELGVSSKTVREWIERGIIPGPPHVEWGIREVLHFPPNYMEKAKAQLDRYRTQKTAEKSTRQG